MKLSIDSRKEILHLTYISVSAIFYKEFRELVNQKSEKKPVLLAHASWKTKVEARGPRVQGYPQLYGEFVARLSYIKYCLQIKINNEKKKTGN